MRHKRIDTAFYDGIKQRCFLAQELSVSITADKNQMFVRLYHSESEYKELRRFSSMYQWFYKSPERNYFYDLNTGDSFKLFWALVRKKKISEDVIKLIEDEHETYLLGVKEFGNNRRDRMHKLKDNLITLGIVRPDKPTVMHDDNIRDIPDKKKAAAGDHDEDELPF